jgi:hypothetical protein
LAGNDFGKMADRTEMGEMKATNLFKVALHLERVVAVAKRIEFYYFLPNFRAIQSCAERLKQFWRQNGRFKSI